MASSDSLPNQNSSDRAGLLRQVLEECIHRRSSGEALPDESVIATHQELMPELAFELRKLGLVERARRFAVHTETTPVVAPGSEVGIGEWPVGLAGYEVVREIHRGGQGAVYEAIQKSTKQKVAIKVLHGGPFADAPGRARLEREVQILGQLNHPYLVRVHDSGSAAGCPYYVMDYISGEALDAYLLRNPLGITAVLQLFAKICDALNAAHLCGVIHRDLKPSNIRIDANGEPHVLDFGLAKVALAAVTDESHPQLMSMTGQFIGSLPWASPEQAEGSPSKIDVRTDVYSLGVILYQLLTGRMPYEVVGNVRDVLDRILKAEPARPSTIRRQINDEIDTIVLKCLAKERQRRYQSAGELGRDIQHYLAGEPIEAKRDSLAYLLGKQLRRHRVPVVVAAAFVLAVTVGCFVSLTLWQQAVRQRAIAEGHAQRADQEAARARLVADFLDKILLAIDPDAAQADPDSLLAKSLRETLDDAASRVQQLASEPEVEARVRNSLGRLYTTLGAYEQAEEHLRRAADLRRQALGPRHEATAETLFTLGWALKEQGKYADARKAYDEALSIRETLFGPESLAVAGSLKGLGQLLYAQKQFALARPYLEKSLELNQRLAGEPGEIANAMANLGSLLRDQGQLAEAEPLLRSALDLRRRLFGDEHHQTLVSMNKLALLLRAKGERAEARELLREYLDLCPKVLGNEHPHVAFGLNSLGLVCYDEGRYAEAEKCFQQALDLYRRTRGPTHPQVAEALVNLGATLHKLGDAKAAAARCEQALDILARDDPGRAPALFLLAQLRLDQEDVAGAATALQEAYRINRDTLGDNHPGTRLVESALAECLRKLGCFEEAAELLRDRYAKLKQSLGPDHPQTIAIVEKLVELHLAWDKPADAARFRELLPPDTQPAEGERP